MSPDVQLAESANAFAQHHDGWEDVARAYAQLSEPLFVAGIVLLALAGVVLRRRRLMTASALAVAASGLAVGAAALIGGIVARPRPSSPIRTSACSSHTPPIRAFPVTTRRRRSRSLPCSSHVWAGERYRC